MDVRSSYYYADICCHLAYFVHFAYQMDSQNRIYGLAFCYYFFPSFRFLLRRLNCMKRLFFILIALLVSLPFWGYPYKVNVSSTLNLRSEPSTASAILLKLNNGDIVECSADLSTISENQTGYV